MMELLHHLSSSSETDADCSNSLYRPILTVQFIVGLLVLTRPKVDEVQIFSDSCELMN